MVLKFILDSRIKKSEGKKLFSNSIEILFVSLIFFIFQANKQSVQ
jgi:hypothetical protein